MSGLAGCWHSGSSDEWAAIGNDLVAGVSHRGNTLRSASPWTGLTLSVVGQSTSDGTFGGCHESKDLVVTFDGYLTEREDLARSLGLAKETPSASLVATLIRHHGLAGLRRLAGHFAFVVWWSAEQRLLLARDALGLRPLFMGQRKGVWAWSSALKPLARVLARSRDIDDDFVADYLSRPHQTTRTPFKAVSSVPPGSVLQIDRDSSRVCPLWDVIDGRTSEPVTDASEYRERFFAAIHGATDEMPGKLFAELSGGMDSSSIVCAADHLHATGRLRRRVETVSHLYDRSPSSDEMLWIGAVERHRRSAGHHLVESKGWLFEGLDRAVDDDLPTGMLCYGGLAQQRLEMAGQGEGAVLLSGSGGDQVTVAAREAPVELADLLWKGDVTGMVAGLPAWSKVLRRPAMSVGVEAAALALNPRATKRITGWARRYLPPWVHPRFVREYDLIDRVTERSWPGDASLSPGMRYRLGLVRDAARWAWAVECRGHRNYVDTRFPFLEPRLVHWTLRVPIGSMTRPDELRALARQQMRDLLPAEITQRKGKRGPDEAILRAVWSHWPVIRELLSRPAIAERGYVDAAAFERSVERAYHGAETETAWLIKTLGLEIWLRQVEASRMTSVS